MLELTPQQQQFVDSQVATGMFQEPSEVFGAALAFLNERQREYAQLQSGIAQVERGEFELFKIDEI